MWWTCLVERNTQFDKRGNVAMGVLQKLIYSCMCNRIFPFI